MTHELKIIMKYQEEDMDHDGDPITSGSFLVYVDGYAIGYIQNLNFNVDIYDMNPKIKITFPKMEKEKIDDSYFVPTKYHSPIHQSEIDYYAKLVSQFPNVEVEMKNIIDTNEEKTFLHEIGTTGNIEAFPTKGSK